jgi:hypothetical protein
MEPAVLPMGFDAARLDLRDAAKSCLIARRKFQSSVHALQQQLR